jgi:diguanylate cyclase (GGDEF)-like protein
MDEQKRITPYLSPAGAWAFSIGTSIGWGSLVVTSNNYLSHAGPLGSTLGLIIGAIVMLVISKNYHYLMNIYPDAGGPYTYTKHIFGYDYGFLTAWFLGLVYLAILWANLTSLPLFARYFFGDFYRFGYLYTVFGYEVYVGEIFLTLAGILLAVFLCTRKKIWQMRIMIVLAAVFTIGICVCFIIAVTNMAKHGMNFEPKFSPHSKPLNQVLRIAAISPWAFIGFENISHSVEGFKFPLKKAFRIFVISIVATTALYVFIVLLSASAYPGFADWHEYIHNISEQQGLNGLPAFHAAMYYMGDTGKNILVISLFALIVTSFIGNTVAISRLFLAVSRDGIFSKQFAQLDKNENPLNCILLIALISVFIPFVGRTAIGWIVDVTTIGATIIYGFVSAAAYFLAKSRRDNMEKKTGLAGLIIMILMLLMLLIPNFFATSGSMAQESYILFTVWSVLGLLFFRRVLLNDREHRFGTTIVSWIFLLVMILIMSLIWMSDGIVNDAYKLTEKLPQTAGQEIMPIIEQLIADIMADIMIVMLLFIIAFLVLVSNYSIMIRKSRASEKELSFVKQKVYVDALTGVKNRNAYNDHEIDINNMISDGLLDHLAIVVCDVNDLKKTNDIYGHKAGDEVIRSASKIICTVFKHSPVYRYGGDEFIAILQGTDYENRMDLIKSLCDISAENIYNNSAVIACGMADYIFGADENLHAIAARADRLMYAHKAELKDIQTERQKAMKIAANAMKDLSELANDNISI